MSHFLAGDIGGTKTRLATVEVTGTQVHIVREVSYPSRDYATFEELLGNFLAGAEIPSHAAFGIAGPVQGRVVQTTNLPWYIDADALQQQFGFAHCTLLNDLEATACGLPALGADDLLTLQAGAPDASGNAAVIAAGTGLGEAGLYWDGQRHQPFATEGGHASFSPEDELEIALLRHLQRQHQHVSWERVVSGMGLLNLHEFLRLYRDAAVPQWLAEEMHGGDAAAAISAAALSGRDDICVETLDWFVRLYGAEAGNLALKVMSNGGLYVGGGIATKILPLLQNGAFIEAFLNKGRRRPLLEAVPVKVILNDRAALLGAAFRAAQLANGDESIMPVSLSPNSLPQAGERDVASLRDHVNAQAIFVHEDPEGLGAAVAQRIAELAAQAIAARGVFHIALAGGETPRRCYEKLRHLFVDWAHVQVYFGDERCLPAGDAGRNDRMARETLLEQVAIPPVNIHAIPAELGARKAAARYAAVLEQATPLDLVLLGMGEDGHIASLFPGNPATGSMAVTVPVFDAPKLPAERVSLGLGTLNAARQRIFLVAGAGKRDALEQIFQGKSLPAALVAAAEWHLDLAALPGR